MEGHCAIPGAIPDDWVVDGRAHSLKDGAPQLAAEPALDPLDLSLRRSFGSRGPMTSWLYLPSASDDPDRVTDRAMSGLGASRQRS